ncbi:MAG: 2,3-bisphosphoglycerate-independent phosphoglycerate mutase [Deltaproteobacteria bacterium]|nr:MAG: 2,3-bisphosphoglycerate-independent phosphoglycerate mutase [Deltaproteobacteria bacterium]
MPPPPPPRPEGPVVLCILDGVGIGRGGEDDAVATALTPNLDRWRARVPFASLAASGRAVGLPTDDDMGNSEVGHNALGAGRIFDQGAKLVDHALQSGAAFRTELWRELASAPTLHLLGLLSDGNVHSHQKHLYALIAQAAADGVSRLRVHLLTDGRDVEARSALTFVEPLERHLAEHREAGRDYRIASGGGRMHITMDRYEADWDMVARGWRCHVHGEGRPFGSASQAIRELYEQDPDVDDQYLPAFVVTDEQGVPNGRIDDGDAVLLFNFRGDRAIEISRAFEEPELTTFDRGPLPDVHFAGMMQYDGDLHVPKRYLVSPPVIDQTVSEHLARAGRRSWACSETQKYGHVTYFFNGNRSGRFDEALEHWLEIPSDQVPFDQRPWMKAGEITDATIQALRSGGYDHLRINYANGDMVGHTGSLEATRVAVSAVDHCLGRLWREVKRAKGVLLITADHGNADEMYQHKGGRVVTDARGVPLARTSHSLNPVPLLVLDPRQTLMTRPDATGGSIARIGSTVLELCGVTPPDDYLPGLLCG